MTYDELTSAARELVVEYYNIHNEQKILVEDVCLDSAYENEHVRAITLTVPDFDNKYYEVTWNKTTGEVRTRIYK